MNLHHISDIEGLIKGDIDCFGAIFHRYNKKVFHYILRFVRSREVAEEITSDVFVKLWNKRSIINPDRSIDGFVFKLAHDFAYDHLRKVARHSKLRTEWIQDYNESVSNTIEESIYLKEELKRIDKVICELPPKRRKVFQMRFQQDMTNDQIAKELDISPNTVKVHLTKASKYVRQFVFNNSDVAWLLMIIICSL